MNISSTVIESIATIALRGRFEFSAHREFRDAVKVALEDARVSTLTIDMNAVEYMDSAALGMLLVARDSATGLKKTVSIARPSETARRTLAVANFETLFAIN